MIDPFGARDRLSTAGGIVAIHRLSALEKAGLAPSLARLPFSVRVLLESLLRHCCGPLVSEEEVVRLARWRPKPERGEIPFLPGRVILQDFTGVPAVVDLASMRAAFKRLGGDPKRINPRIPVDLVIDHSVQVDFAGSPDALRKNMALEFERNRERYALLRWSQRAFEGFRVVPPSAGIIHQVNLECLAEVVLTRAIDGETVAFPDTLVGTDSHTTMINGLGVLGWGVGGIEAEAAMLGQPLDMLVPEVVGVRLSGRLREGVTATDLVLTVTQLLRRKGVVEKLVEFFGPGVGVMSLADRATVANMAPEYGATTGFFPVDKVAIEYLRRTGRGAAAVDLVERYTKEQGLFRVEDGVQPEYSDVLALDLGDVEPSLAGPKRPHDRVALADMAASFDKALTAPVNERGFGLKTDAAAKRVAIDIADRSRDIGHGAVVIAAITSCTNTSNPSVMLGAGLIARAAAARGLRVPPHVKTSLAPGSQVVTEYLRKTGLLGDLEAIGFHVVGYGCMTCIGNSGPLAEPVSRAVRAGGLIASAVLSGNRNFEGRVHPDVKANYLASPMLVVAYALAGSVAVDLTRQPIGVDHGGRPVYLRELWPSHAQVEALDPVIDDKLFGDAYARVFEGSASWNAIPAGESALFDFQAESTYIREAPFFMDLALDPPPVRDIRDARILALLGDSVTTDHISPAGVIPEDSPAGKYLTEHGVSKSDFNSYGSRRGNDCVMARGTFGNVRLRNLMLPGVEGGFTIHVPSGEQMAIFDAAERYRAERTPLVVVAGREYGSGSSRDWAAKGTLLLGVHAVIAAGFERIHRSNLVGMGVLPLEFERGQNAESLGLTGREKLTIPGVGEGLAPRQRLTVEVERSGRERSAFQVVARLDTPIEVKYYRNGGILHAVLRDLLRTEKQTI
ncbi:MAG: aconitate hydratase AcnA [Vicinamibacteria bacterium]|nr:aconitate hydratase AcnA [Vicinamibacteria bacterium]